MKNKYKEWLEVTALCLKDIKEIIMTEIYPPLDYVVNKIAFVVGVLPFILWVCFGLFRITGCSFVSYMFFLFLLFCPAYVFTKKLFKEHDYFKETKR